MSDPQQTRKEELKKLIVERCLVLNKDEQIDTFTDPDAWLFDFRRILLNGASSDLIAEYFYAEFKDKYPFQLGTLEIAGVPLVTSLMNKFYEKGHHDVNAFFIRKSRKKSGVFRMIEGTLDETKKIILVDDIMNSGNSFWRQIEVLEQLEYKVDTVWSLLRFRDHSAYKRFQNRGINVQSVLELDDLTESTSSRIRNIVAKNPKLPAMPFTPLWRFTPPNPSYMWVLPKSQPVIDDEKLYYGTDDQIFYALNQSDGSIAWSFKTGTGGNKKSIFSSPALHDNTVFFGSYDGNVYALDAQTGKQKWMYYEADWVGSSPVVAPDLGLVFIGLEFGLVRKRGGIVALDIKTGKRTWCDFNHPSLTHGSPHYITTKQQVAIGSNDGVVRLYDAKTGDLKWKFTTFGGADYDSDADRGFGKGDIKESLAYDVVHDYLVFGSLDGFLYVLNRRTGHLVHHVKTDASIFGTPYIYKKYVYFTSLDKNIRCLDLDTFELIFEKSLDLTRIFAGPTVINDRLYVGTNAARLHELDPLTGDVRAYFQALERITNHVVYNSKTNRFFLPTYANEIIALTRSEFADDSTMAK